MKNGFTEDVFNLFVSKFKVPSETRGTLHNYQVTWDKFTTFCRDSKLDRDAMELKDIANFVAVEFKKGAVGSKIDAHLTALDMTRRFLFEEATPIGQYQLIKDLRKAAKARRPPQRNAKPKSYFDPAQLYLHLAGQVKTRQLKSADLRQKTEMLMVLDAAARGSDLHRVCLDFITWDEKKVTVRAYWTKEEKSAKLVPITFFCTCNLLENACTFCAIKEYSSRPRIVRRRKKAKKIEIIAGAGPTKALPFFLSHRGKAAAISIATIRKDLQSLMTRTGIDPIWTPHDIRGAVASKLINLQAGDQRVMDLGRWKSRQTMMKHYFRQAFYVEASSRNEKEPLCKLLRERVRIVDERTLERIDEALPSEGEERDNGSH